MTRHGMLALMAVVAAGCSTPSSTAPSPTAKVNAAPSPAPGPTPDYKEFHIAAAGSYLGFPENDGPVLVEQLDPTTYLSFNALGYMNGGVTGASAGAIITTGFDSAEYCVLTTPFEGTWFPCRPASLIADSLCTGNNRLTLIRR
jgi:hypothetical protein